MEFFDTFLKQDTSAFTQSNVKQFGFEIDYFSRVYGRMLMVGNISYQANKNYRSKHQFEQFRKDNTISIPAVVLLFEESDYVISNIESIDNLFINKFDEIKEKYCNSNAIKMFGYVKKPKVRKNGKSGRSYKIHRCKRFIIPITYLLYEDNKSNNKFCDTTAIHCTFLKKLT
jgi:hypothetical protein